MDDFELYSWLSFDFIDRSLGSFMVLDTHFVLFSFKSSLSLLWLINSWLIKSSLNVLEIPSLDFSKSFLSYIVRGNEESLFSDNQGCLRASEAEYLL